MKITYPFLAIATLLAAGCAQHGGSSSSPTAAVSGKSQRVRTTAYTHSERGHLRYGKSNAIGTRLTSGSVKSAASDWSRFPVGTEFRIKETGEVYRIDDYGSALVGTKTIDLYKTTRGQMNQWGVRFVTIEILKWGSPRTSLEILEPRARHRHVRAMVTDLRRQI